jgi:hypothetical protein
MKKITKIVLLFVALTGLPCPTLAWPMVLHDDGQYQALAVTSAGKIVVSAVATPATVELTVVSPRGQRLGWFTLQIPEAAWNLPNHKLSIQLEQVGSARYRLTVILLAGEAGSIEAGYRHSLVLTRTSGGIQFVASEPVPILVPQGATDAAVWWAGQRSYLVWQTQDEDNIATVRLTSVQ